MSSQTEGGYMSMEASDSSLAPDPSKRETAAKLTDLNMLNSKSSYVPFTAIQKVTKNCSPGYISIGQIPDLVVKPDLLREGYSKITCSEHKNTSVPCLAESKEFSVTFLSDVRMNSSTNHSQS